MSVQDRNQQPLHVAEMACHACVCMRNAPDAYRRVSQQSNENPLHSSFVHSFRLACQCRSSPLTRPGDFGTIADMATGNRWQAEQAAREGYHAAWKAARERLRDRPLHEWERPTHRSVIAPVPATVRASDCWVLAAWIATADSLRDHGLATRVILRFPATEAMGREVPFDREAARRAVEQLRAGHAANLATVVRLARHRLETE